MLSKEGGCWESTNYKPLTLHIICRVMLLVPTLIHLKHTKQINLLVHIKQPLKSSHNEITYNYELCQLTLRLL